MLSKPHSKLSVVLVALILIFSATSHYYGLTITNTKCNKNENLAIIRLDGNLYLYETCLKSFKQLTHDGKPATPQGGKKNRPYYFYDPLKTWSSNGTVLLVGKGSQTHLIDAITQANTTLADRAIFAEWSPNSQMILITRAPDEQASLYLDPLTYNSIVVKSAKDFSVILDFKGNAPAWINNSEIIYFSPDEFLGGATQNVIHMGHKLKIDGDSLNLKLKLETGGGAVVRDTRLSSNGQYAAVYSERQRNLGLIRLNSDETFEMGWVVRFGISPTVYHTNTYSWSPIEPILAICTPPAMADGSFPSSDGAVLFVGSGYPTWIVNDRRCMSNSNVSWQPSGQILSFINRGHTLSFVNIASHQLMVEPSQTLSINEGPWWSFDGNYIGVIAGGKICLSPYTQSNLSLQFECIADGVEMAWRP